MSLQLHKLISPRTRTALLACAAILAFFAAPPALAPAQSNGASEHQVKAALLPIFARFIEWPPEAFGPSGAPFVIGVLGNDPFGSNLEAALGSELVKNRPIVVKRSQQLQDLKNCHMLFISNSERDRVRDILADLDNTPIVTVSEVPDFALRGGIINFYIQDQKVRFEINPRAAERRNLKISAQLLRRARLVDS